VSQVRTAAAAPAVRRVTRAPLFALFTAEALSMTGNVVTLTAIPWFVLETTGSAARTGITAFFTTLPVVLSAFFGGVIVDRLGPKRASVIADVASGVTVAAVPLLYHTVGLAFWQLLVLVFLGALLDTPGQTARKAVLPDLADAAGMRLERANAATQAINRGARMAGAPLAGLLIVLLGASNALWVDAATFMVSAVLVGALVPAATRSQEPATAGRGYLGQLREGLAYLGRDRLVRVLVLLCLVANFLDGPKLAVLLPIYANQVLGSPVALGIILGTYGGAALLGAVVYGAVGHRWPRRGVLIAALLTFGVPFWALSTRPTLPVMLAALVITGLASGPVNPLLATVMQERVPSALRGRVWGIAMAGSYAAMPLGMLVTGTLVEWAGFVPTVTTMASAYLLLGVSLFVLPALRELGQGHQR
jgi:MFS family permease